MSAKSTSHDSTVFAGCGVARRFAFLACLSLLACSSGAETEGGSPTKAVEFDMRVVLPSGAERHYCELFRMPESPGEIFVSGGSYTTSPGTHHFLLFRTAPDTPKHVLGEPFDCTEGVSIMKYERGFVTGGQLASDSESFPAGLGLPFASEELLLLQGHFVNASAKAVTAGIHVELETAVPSTITERVGTYRFYDPFIYVAPHASARAQMRCHLHHDVVLISAGSHMHQRGKSYAAFFDPAGEASSSVPFYTTNDWQHPPFYYGPLSIKAGSSLRFQCDYDNDLATPLDQGPSAEHNEMCMLSAFYYPAQDADEEDCSSMDMHGTGTRSCAQTLSCISLCPPSEEPDFGRGSASVGSCFQQCIVDSCPNVTASLFPELQCIHRNCSSDCKSYTSACTSCALRECRAEVNSCQALSCGQ